MNLSEFRPSPLNTLLIVIIVVLIAWYASSHIRENMLSGDPKIDEIKRRILPLFDGNIKYDGILEPLNNRKVLDEVNIFVGDKSYTINKEKIFMCLKDENGNYYDDNMLIYVLLHEISHVICREIGHTPLFHKIFDELLAKAEQLKIYDSRQPIVMNYCNYKKN